MKMNREIGLMRKALQSLESKQERLEETVSNREDYYHEKSEKWQESDNGIDYMEKTEQLDNALDTIANIVSELEEHISSLEELI